MKKRLAASAGQNEFVAPIPPAGMAPGARRANVRLPFFWLAGFAIAREVERQGIFSTGLVQVWRVSVHLRSNQSGWPGSQAIRDTALTALTLWFFTECPMEIADLPQKTLDTMAQLRSGSRGAAA